MPADFNNHAWFLLATGRNDEAALALAQRGVDGNGLSEGFLHTLAAIQADLGHLQDARDTIVRKITISPSRRAKPIDAIVFGRIAELLSETELALSEYRKVPPETRAAVDLDSPWSLAKPWIQRAAAGIHLPRQCCQILQEINVLPRMGARTAPGANWSMKTPRSHREPADGFCWTLPSCHICRLPC